MNRSYIFQSSPLTSLQSFDGEVSEMFEKPASEIKVTIRKSEKWKMSRMILKTFAIFQCAIWQSTQIQFTSNSFGSCLKQENPNILECAGKQAIETLQQLNNAENFTLTDGVVLSKDESVMGRNAPINFLDNDPNDFRWLC